MIKLPDITSDFTFATHHSEIDIQYVFEQQKDSTQISFSSQLSYSFSIVLGNYMKLIKNITHLQLRILPNQIGAVGITGISKGLWFLDNLEDLYLEIQNNNINEVGCQGLCVGISTLHHLKSLSLIIGECNYIKDDGVKSISYSIKSLVKLEKLVLIFEDNLLEQKSGHHLGQGIKGLNLKEFMLTINPGNQIQSEGAQGISLGLSELTNLEVLQMVIINNKIGQPGFQSLGEAIQKIQNLQKLSLCLSQTNVKLNESNNISQAVKNLKNLNYLFLDIQKDQEVGLSLVNLVNLTYLNIKLSDKVGRLGVINFGQGIKRLFNLIELSIFVEKFNKMDPYSVQEICESLKNLQKLEKLSFILDSSNNVQDGAVYIGDALQNLIKLTYLKLHILRENDICFQSAQVIGQSFKQLTSLEILNLEIGSLNNITTEGLVSISEGISCLINLKDLKIVIGSKNKINNQAGYNEFSKNINKLKQLECLHFQIGSEGLTQIGDIYRDLINLKQLSFVVVTDNQIKNSAGIGLGFHNLINLTSLTFQIESGNEIGEEGASKIALGFSYLVNLRQLRIAFGCHNLVQKEGATQLGKNISKLTNLEELYLQIDEDNQIQQEGMLSLSSELSKLQSLKKLDLNIQEPYVMSAISLLKNNTNLNSESFNFSNKTRNDFHYQRSTKEEIEILGIPYYFNLYLSCSLYSIIPGLRVLTSLTSLTIMQNKQNLSSQTLTDLSHSIQQLPNLKQLDLQFLNSDFSFQIVRKICECFGKLVNLESLKFVIINSFSFKQKDQCQIPSLATSLKKLKNLKNLSFIIDYEFDKESYKKLGQGINSLVNLESLEFFVYNYSLVKDWFTDLKNLKKLILNYIFGYSQQTKITGMFSELYKQVSHLKKINCFKVLCLRSYRLNLFEFPVQQTLEQLNELRYLEINTSNLQIDKQHLLNLSIRTQKRLVVLQL